LPNKPPNILFCKLYTMSTTLTKIWNQYGIGIIVVLLLVAFGLNSFSGYLNAKGSIGFEKLTSTPNDVYSNTPNQKNQVVPADPNGNEKFASVSGIQSSMSTGLPSSCSRPTIQDPRELLPKDTNSQWASLNPSGQGELANVSLLKSGYHIGIDSIGSSLRNANLQIRSEPPNPQIYTGPWNLSTITPDFLRPPLEIGSGGQ